MRTECENIAKQRNDLRTAYAAKSDELQAADTRWKGIVRDAEDREKTLLAELADIWQKLPVCTLLKNNLQSEQHLYLSQVNNFV